MRLSCVEGELQRTKQQMIEQEAMYNNLRNTLSDMEEQMGRKTMELQQKDDAIRQIDIDVREMQAEIERAERANEMLKTENDCLMRDVENLRRGEDE